MSLAASKPPLDGISVLIPTKNRADLLHQTLRSVAEQSLPAVEVIVADDGSTDHTNSVVRDFGARRLLNAKGDWGPAAARNAAMDAARTRYLAFIDSDDLYHPLALERLHDALVNREDAPFAFGRGLAARHTAGRWESDGVIGPRRWELDNYLCSLFARNTIPSGGVLVGRDVALGVGGFDPRSWFAQDHAFWLRLVQLGMPVHVPEIVCIHRRHGGNRMSPMIAADYYQLITDVAREDERLAACVPRRLGVQMCEIALDAARQRSLHGLWIAARQLLRGKRRAEMLRSAGAFFRARREDGEEGASLLASDGELREWLAKYH